MVCSLVDEPVRTKSGGGMTVNAPYRLADVEQADTIVIPMWHGDDPPSAEVVDALRAAPARGVRMISFCRGAFLLAHAGLPDGPRAATPWMFAERLASAFPALHLVSAALYLERAAPPPPPLPAPPPPAGCG